MTDSMTNRLIEEKERITREWPHDNDTLYDYKIDKNGKIIKTIIPSFTVIHCIRGIRVVSILRWKSNGYKTLEYSNIDRYKNGHIVSFNSDINSIIPIVIHHYENKLDTILKEKERCEITLQKIINGNIIDKGE